MRPRRSTRGIFLLTMIFLCTAAGAQTVFDVAPSQNSRMHDRASDGGRPPHRRPAAIGKGFRYPGGQSRIYLLDAFLGTCTLVLSHSAGEVNLRPAVSVFDRWPYDPAANRYDLPMGPVVATGGKKVEYRWTMTVSPASTGTLLYVAVEIPEGAHSTRFLPHDISVSSTPGPSIFSGEAGITFLSGPENLVLQGGTEPPSGSLPRAGTNFDPDALGAVPIPGDLVRNGSFRDGLTHWTPHRDRVAANDVASFSLEDRVLKIRSTSDRRREGVMQQLETDVSEADALLLTADVQVREQTEPGLGAEGRDAPMAVAVAYRAAAREKGVGDSIYWVGFHVLAPEGGAPGSAGRRVAKGQWHRATIDLMRMDPKPATLLFISLEGSGWPAREGWIRDVHLIRSGGTK